MINHDNSDQFLSGVFQCYADEHLTIAFANDRFYNFLNYSPDQMFEKYHNKLENVILQSNSKQVYDDILLQLQKTNAFSVQCAIEAADMTKKWMWISAELISDEDGVQNVYCIFFDMTKQKQEQEDLKEMQERYLFILNHTEDIVFEWNYETKQMLQMGGFAHNFKYNKVIQKFPDDLVDEHTNIHPDDISIFLENYQKYENGATEAYAEYRLKDKSGIYSWCATTSVGLFENGKLKKVLGRITNINDQKMQLLELSRRAMRDPLTELYNRKATQSFVDKYIETTLNLAAVMIIDLDNFKLINDTHGHLVGDSVLNEVANAITGIFRSSDVIGRIGGDEFIVFLTDVKTENDVTFVADKVLKTFKEILDNRAQSGTVSGSIGISFYPKDGNNYEMLLDKADKALYTAKKTGKNKYVIYSDFLQQTTPLKENFSYKRTPNESRRRESLYQLILEKAKLNVWEYDIKNRRINRILNSVTTQSRGTVSFENYPYDLIEKGYVHKNSVQPLLDMYEKLFQGEQDVSADICTISPIAGLGEWQHITYATLYDIDGNPDIAVGTSKNITEQKTAQIKYQRELEMRSVLENGILCTSVINLTQNVVEQYKNLEFPNINENTIKSYEDLLSFSLEHIPNPTDTKKHHALQKDTLMKMFIGGKPQILLDYRREGINGLIKWVSLSMYMLQDSQNSDIYLYLVLRDIDSQKRRELSLKERAKIDEYTGAYLQNTFESITDAEMQNCLDTGSNFALVNFSVDKFLNIIQFDGKEKANEVVLELVKLVNYKFAGKPTGRFFENQILVFIPNVQNRAALSKKVNTICAQIKNNSQSESYKTKLTISSSVVFSNDNIKDFKTLYNYSNIALDTARKSGFDKCIIYSETALIKEQSQTLPANNSTFTDVVLRCAMSVLDMADQSKGTLTILNELGAYYDAYRAFVAEYVSKDGLGNVFVWSKQGSQIVSQNIIPELIKECPYIYNELINNDIIFWDNEKIDSLKSSHSADYNKLSSKGVQKLFAAILKSDGEIVGYISVINPAKNSEDTNLFMMLYKILSNEFEKRHLHEKHKFLSRHDKLTSLYNRNQYIYYAQHFNPDSVISLGVISADINGLKHINNLQGHQYGDFVVQKTAQTLTSVFKDYACYRFAGDEFIVICENISKKSLYSRIETLRDIATSFSEFGISIGYSWGDTDVNLEHLISVSDEKMMNEKQNYYISADNKAKGHNPAETHTLLKEIDQGKFVVYLQPKINAKTQEAMGAEALIRYIDEKNGVLSPDKFIPKMEQNGTIKYIDLFVVEKSCEILRKWIDVGKTPISISVNLSRATLLYENIIEELCGIVDSFNLPRNLIEIEITESFTEIDKLTIAEMGNKICAAGFKLALDDFGAKYSNLSILSATKWDTLKLDKSLVNDIFSNKNTQIIVENLFLTCKKMGIQTVAEGVETKEQFEIVKNLDCMEIQGYYFNKPLPLDDFVKYYMK